MHINNYHKWKWTKCPNQKTQIGYMDTETRHSFMLSTTDPLHIHIQTNSEGLEKDISCKKKSKESGVAILISYKIDFKDHYKRQGNILHMSKESIKEEDIAVNNT